MATKKKRKFVVKKKPKVYKVKPTKRAKKAFQILTENERMSQREALKQAGFSDEVADHPKKVTESKGWKQLCKEYLPDEDIVAAHKKLMLTGKLSRQSFPLNLSNKEIKEMITKIRCEFIDIKLEFEEYTDKKGNLKKRKRKFCYYLIPDPIALKSAIDMAYKVKNKYPATSHKIGGTVKVKDYPYALVKQLIQLEIERQARDSRSGSR